MQEELTAVSEVLQYNIDMTFAEGRKTSLIENIINLAKNAGISLAKAMSLLEVPEEEQQDLLALIKEKASL